MKAIFKNETEDVVASVVSEPSGIDVYNKKLEKSEQDFENGNVISHNDLKKKYNLDYI